MKRIVKKISTIALTVIAMLTVFTVHPSIASESFSTTMVYAEPEEVKVEDKGSGSSSSGSSGSTEGDTVVVKLFCNISA